MNLRNRRVCLCLDCWGSKRAWKAEFRRRDRRWLQRQLKSEVESADAPVVVVAEHHPASGV